MAPGGQSLEGDPRRFDGLHEFDCLLGIHAPVVIVGILDDIEILVVPPRGPVVVW
jgi:hypothetical protein